MSDNRFQRTKPATDMGRPNEAESEDIGVLLARHRAAQDRRIRLETQRDSVARDLAKLIEDMKNEFGVGTLEELEVLREETERSEKEAWAAFQAAVQSEEKTLSSIESALKELDERVND